VPPYYSPIPHAVLYSNACSLAAPHGKQAMFLQPLSEVASFLATVSTISTLCHLQCHTPGITKSTPHSTTASLDSPAKRKHTQCSTQLALQPMSHARGTCSHALGILYGGTWRQACTMADSSTDFIVGRLHYNLWVPVCSCNTVAGCPFHCNQQQLSAQSSMPNFKNHTLTLHVSNVWHRSYCTCEHIPFLTVTLSSHNNRV
jgi:hypothetical protein